MDKFLLLFFLLFFFFSLKGRDIYDVLCCFEGGGGGEEKKKEKIGCAIAARQVRLHGNAIAMRLYAVIRTACRRTTRVSRRNR